MTIDLDKLEELARAATPGEWHRSDRPAGPFWHIYADHTVGGKPCINGKQSIGSMHAENRRTGSKAYAAMFEANASFVAAANPAAILELIAEVRKLRETIRLQANAARAGMDAAKRHATILYAEADKARAESSPDVLASERQANAMLTEENEKLRIDADRYRRLKSFADPSYNVRTMSNAHSASLAKEEFLTVHAGSWEAMDAVLDGVVTVNTVNIKEQS